MRPSSQSPVVACRPAAGLHPPVCSGRLVNASEQHFISRQEELKMFTGLEKKKFSPDATKMGGGIVDLIFFFSFICVF